MRKMYKIGYFSLIKRDLMTKKPRHHVEAFEVFECFSSLCFLCSYDLYL